MLNRKLNAPFAAFMKSMRSAAMWAVWNIPLGKFAPWLMGFAMTSKPRKVKSSN